MKRLILTFIFILLSKFIVADPFSFSLQEKGNGYAIFNWSDYNRSQIGNVDYGSLSTCLCNVTGNGTTNLTGYAQYNFGSNNFVGSGNFTNNIINTTELKIGNFNLTSDTKAIEFNSPKKHLTIDMGEDWKYGVTFDVEDIDGNGNIIRWGDTFMMVTGQAFNFDSQSGSKIYSTTGSNEVLRMTTAVGGYKLRSGYITIESHRVQHTITDSVLNPTLRIYANESDLTSYIQLYHNKDNARIDAGKGQLVLNSTEEVNTTNDLIVNSNNDASIKIGKYAQIESKHNGDGEESCSLTSTQSVDMKGYSDGFVNFYDQSSWKAYVRLSNGDIVSKGDITLQGNTQSVISGYLSIGNSIPLYPLSVNKTSGDISIWASGNISANGYITRTSVYDKSEGSALNKINDASYYISNGKIDHSKFYGYVSYNKEVSDTSKSIINIENKEEIVSYPVTYNITEEGVSLDKEIDLLRQAVYELKTELCKVNDKYEFCS